MTNENVIATSECGNYRVRIERHPHPDMPYNDGGTPVLRLDGGGRYMPSVEEVTEATSYRLPHEIIYALRWLVDEYGRGRGLEMFSRYLRIFHGSTSFVTRGPDRNTDYTYVSFDTEAWREALGVTPVEGHEVADLSEINAWLDGEVYVAVIEERGYVVTMRLDANMSPHSEGEPEEEWFEADTVGGFYGREVAERGAREEMAEYLARIAGPGAA